jgi:hypothetical protein
VKEFRTTIVLFVIVLLLGGFVFFRKEWGPIKEDITFVDIQPNNVVELTIENERANKPVTLQKEQGTWWMVKPLRARADQSFVENTLNQLKDLTATDDVTDSLKGRDLKEYYLGDNPRALLTVRLKSGQQHTLRFGDKAIQEDLVYTRLENDRIVLVKSPIFDQLNGQDVDGFRDKKLLTVDREKIDQITLTHANQVVQLGRKNEREWKLTQPISTDADANAVDALLNKLENLAAAKFVDEQPKDLNPYGLNQPQFRVDVKVKGRKEPYTVLIGKEGTGANLRHLFAMTQHAKPVVALTDYMVRDLKQDVKTLRAKTVLTYIPNDVRRFSLTYPGQPPIELEQTNQETTPQWHLKQPIEGPADREVADFVVLSLNGQVADDFVDKPASLSPYGLDAPQVEVALWVKDDKKPTHVLRIGKKTKTANSEGVFVQKEGDETVYRVAGSQWLDKVKVTLAQLRDKQILRYDVADAEKFAVIASNKILVAERRDVNHWDIVQPTRQEADASKVNAYVEILSNLRGDEFVQSAPSEADLKKYSLDKPALTVEVFLRNKDTNKRQGTQILVSKESDKGQVYVFRSRFQPTVYRAQSDLLDELKIDVKDLKK